MTTGDRDRTAASGREATAGRATVTALLAACAGVVDVWAVVALGGAFAGVVTGNLVTGAHALVAGGWGELLPPAVAVAGFAAGAVAWSSARRRWPHAIGWPLAAELLVLTASAVVWALAGDRAGVRTALLVAAAFAMGGQSSISLRLGPSSTYMTGTLTGALADLAAGAGRRWSAWRQLGGIVAGALAGGVLLVYLPAAVPVLATVLLGVALGVHLLDARPRSAPG
ncbi:YoaK family protein [Pseudonocardia nematodicida]|uniref:YoaK family protein n=1 Tax=Pseudonocardia nematodicida TaxID=1206997 RepID=A0ABV1KH66_9PSEU